MKLILTGFMGSGKTSVAKHLSILCQLPVLEMDEHVLLKTGCANMQQVFDQGGELRLRELEITLSREWSVASRAIISTGGGVILNKVNLDYLKQGNGKIIFLNTSFKTIAQRLANDNSRPLFNNISEAQGHYDFRLPLYLKYADHIVDADNKSATEVAQEIYHTVHHG